VSNRNKYVASASNDFVIRVVSSCSILLFWKMVLKVFVLLTPFPESVLDRKFSFKVLTSGLSAI
jgi:hypothetical protein